MNKEGTKGMLYTRYRWGPAFIHVLQGLLDKHQSFTISGLSTAMRQIKSATAAEVSNYEVSQAVTDQYHNTNIFGAGWAPANVGGATKRDGDNGKKYRVWCFILELRDMTPDLDRKHRDDAKLAAKSHRRAPRSPRGADADTREDTMVEKVDYTSK